MVLGMLWVPQKCNQISQVSSAVYFSFGGYVFLAVSVFTQSSLGVSIFCKTANGLEVFSSLGNEF